ncbi:MAG: hypothetical protein RIF32_18980 [Leptospirales bacterium]|jgi:2-polyprenyl-6-methoxyphenol hydroxylase-like FAD-dependent oxidoreductase
MKQLGKRAIVIGGSIVGMMAARVLSERFESVIVLDRDPAPEGPFPHRSVPQGAHIHVLMSKGRSVLARLFPGIFEELTADGALRTDSIQDLVWFHGGAWKARMKSGIDFFLQSRPLIDWHVRRRLLQDCPNVELQTSVEAERLYEMNGRITGVSVRAGRKAGSLRLDCDLLVDSSGRGSRMPRWLGEMGYDAPEEQKVVVNIGYTTRLYEQPAKSDRDWSAMMIYPVAPRKKLGYIYPIEPDARGAKRRWIVTMAGVQGDHAPMDAEGFLNYARNLSRPHIYENIRDAKPVSNFSAFKFPATRRLRYDRCKRLPEGFVSVGDSLATFNPIYGQGMSVGAIAVDLLESCLDKFGLQKLTKRYFRRAYWVVTFIPWLLVTAEDYRYEETKGKRPFGLPILHWYLNRVNRLAAQNARIATEFLKVLHFIRTPAALGQPYILLRVIGNALGLYRPQVNPRAQDDYMALPPGEGLQASMRRKPSKSASSQKTKKRAPAKNGARNSSSKAAKRPAAAGKKVGQKSAKKSTKKSAKKSATKSVSKSVSKSAAKSRSGSGGVARKGSRRAAARV